MRGKLIGLIAVLVMVLGLTVPASAGSSRPLCLFATGNPVEGCGTGGIPQHNYSATFQTAGAAATRHAQAAEPDQAITDMEAGVTALGVGNRPLAQQDFVASATAFGAAISLVQVGFLDPNGNFVSQPDQWRVDVGNHLTSGINLLRQGQTGPGMAQFDAAYAELAQNL